MKANVVCPIIIAALLGSVAHAGEGVYVEAGVSPVKISGGGVSVTPDVAVARLGYDFTRNFSVEAFAAKSFRPGSLNGEDIDIDSAYGGYLKGRVEVWKGLELFAKAGYATIRLAAAGAGSASDSAFSYAAGVQYRFAGSFFGLLDYTSYYDKQGLRIAGPTLSVGVRF